MKVKIKKDMGLGLFMLAVIFLCNPIIGFIDVLPDCIGFLLIFNGLRFVADMDEHLEAAKKRFLILFWAGVSQIVLQMLVYNFLQGAPGEETNPYGLPSTVLSVSFVWFVLYVAVLIPSFKELFLGLDRLCERFGYETVSCNRKGRSIQKSDGERMIKKTAAFVFVIALLGLLPELSILTSFEHYVGSSTFRFDWYEFIGMFRTLAVLFSLGFSVAWVISFLRYFGRLKKDKPWIERMKEHYRREVLPKTGMLAMRRFSAAFVILYVGIIFAIHLKMNFYACLPGVIFAFLVCAGVSSLGDLLPPQRNTYIAAGALALFSVAQIIANRIYLGQYLPDESLFNPNAFWYYLVVQLFEIGEAVFTVVLVAYLLQTLYEIVKAYTGIRYGGEESKSLSYSATQKLHNSFRVRMYVIFILFFISAVGNVADVVLHFHFGWLWLIPLCFSVLGVFFYQSLQHDLLDEIRYRYQSEEAYPKE